MAGNNFPFNRLNSQCIDFKNNVNIDSSKTISSFCDPSKEIPSKEDVGDWLKPDPTSGLISKQFTNISELIA